MPSFSGDHYILRIYQFCRRCRPHAKGLFRTHGDSALQHRLIPGQYSLPPYGTTGILQQKSL